MWYLKCCDMTCETAELRPTHTSVYAGVSLKTVSLCQWALWRTVNHVCLQGQIVLSTSRFCCGSGIKVAVYFCVHNCFDVLAVIPALKSHSFVSPTFSSSVWLFACFARMINRFLFSCLIEHHIFKLLDSFFITSHENKKLVQIYLNMYST